MEVYTLTDVSQFISFKFEEPIENTIAFKDVFDNLTGTGEVLKEFRYTKNTSDWSLWVMLNKENVSTIPVIPTDSIYFEFKYTLTTPGNVSFSEITFEREIKAEDPNQGFVPTTYTVESGIQTIEFGSATTSLISVTDTCDTLFNPYLMNQQSGVYREIVNGINSMFGIEVSYIKLDPQLENDSITFREHTIFGARDPECIKVLIPNNEFPDSKPSFNPWGIQFEIPFEIHVTKDNFQKFFGVDGMPQKGDIVYFPSYNRLFEISSSYAHKGFMLQETYWMVALKKYRHKSNTYMTESTEDMIDDLTKGAEEVFGEKIKDETLQITNPQQFSTGMGTSNQEPTRKEVSKNLISLHTKIENYSTIVSESIYDLTSVFDVQERKEAVIYWPAVNFTETSDLSFSTWYKTKEPPYKIYEDPISIVSVSGNSIIVNINAIRNYQIGSILSIKRDAINMFFGTITEIISNTAYRLEIPTEVLGYLGTVGSWSTKTGYKAKLEFPKQFINGHDGTLGWKLDSVQDKFFILSMNDKQYYFISDKILDDNWYGLFLSMSNAFKQVSLSVWEIDETTSSTELKNTFKQTYSNIEPENRSTTVNYILYASNHLQTNLRIFNKVPEFEKQSNILNQNIVQDAQLAVLIDNANEIHGLPYIGHTK